MNYIEAFENLRTNNKWGRKSPHKAVLMLTVIELYEKNVLQDNEIYYDDTLKATFLQVWKRVLPNEPIFHPDAYLPFWYLQGDSFWHIVPQRGKEDILSLMRDSNIKPSEAKLNDSVKYAELDDDLYFLMTIASGRSSLKRALLETYTNLTEEQIDRLAESTDNAVDHSISAMNEYERILSSAKNNETVLDNGSSSEMIQQFRKLNDDLQIALNYEYYSFLKSHRSERDLLREACPDVYTLYDCLVNNPLHQTDISPSFAFIYHNFLCDLKIALMSENESMELIDKIDNAIAILQGNDVACNNPETEERIDATDVKEEKELILVENNRNDDSNLEVEHVNLDSGDNNVKKRTSFLLDDSTEEEPAKESRRGKAWTQEEEERITLYFQRGIETADIAEKIGRTEVAIKARLAKLGLIEYTYGEDEVVDKPSKDKVITQDDFKIENSFTRCCILNKNGEKVFTADGKLKFIRNKLYRINLKDACFTVKDMQFNGEVWMKGDKKIVAYPKSRLYQAVDSAIDYYEVIEDIVDAPTFEECKLKIDGFWYDNWGNMIVDSSLHNTFTEENPKRVSELSRIIKSPQYESRKQAILRALSYFRLPAKLRDITRTISRTAWGTPIKEDEVEDIINTIAEVESSDGKYILQRLNKEKETFNNHICTPNNEKDISVPSPNSKVNIGNWIQWKPTGVVGKVVRFKKEGNTYKIIMQTKSGEFIEVNDNPSLYEIIIK